MSCTILHENRAYWTGRSVTYSQQNREELTDEHRSSWRSVITEQIQNRFPNKAAEELRILEVGTGPGFFAIILAEAGYQVTAIDLTPAMLEEAKRNAGALAGKIDFREMNAEELTFSDNTFDVIVTRNLTWNLPHPESAYREWCRVLKPGGMLLNFDANWYNYLFFDEDKQGYESDRQNAATAGVNDLNVGTNYDVMEDIARRVPLSAVKRPEWDLNVLSQPDMKVTADRNIWKRVWSRDEQLSFASTPMFLIQAVKQTGRYPKQ